MKKIGLILLSCLLLISASLLPTDFAAAAPVYTDIPVKHRAYKEIYYLAQSDITTSDNPTLFSPDAPMTRAHAAAMIGKAIQLTGDQATTQFSDVNVSHFASGYIAESVNRGIIKGYLDGTFKPDETLKRGEMALLISRAFGYQSDSTTAAAQEFMDKGISQGTGNGIFGTGDLMKRGDFSIFLARAINAEFRVGNKALSATPMYVNVDESTSLNMRQGPSTEYTTTKQLFAGYPVDVFYRVGDWLYTKVDNNYGFLHSGFLSTDQPIVSSIKDPIDLVVDTNTPKTIDQLVVIIDPGHGAHDPGAIGFGLKEKDVVLDVSLRMKKYFQQTPIPVALTRETDVFVTLQDRVKFAQQNQGDVFISVHANAFNGSTNGTETFYYSAARNAQVDESKALTTYIHKRMLEAWKLSDRKVKKGNLHVLRENSMPATLIEMGFIDNKSDNAYLASAERREQMARGIFLGTLDYYYHYEGRTEMAAFYSKFNATPSAKHY
ncbi:N-acetylmuramoyl-L-alanine amidase [Sporosarcina beigongshangi]|uniref:N-acetylmuramoyl-L-alanine amidase n=1 Tax=Sporosarcina beigongshangi TaxID=2782538 RepID=UPI0019394701|nr:N-acetylmuramoyl-L-alanine amidase [Sporosarcina beigongshangi]